MSHSENPTYSQPLSASLSSRSSQSISQTQSLCSENVRDQTWENSRIVQSLHEPCSKGRCREGHSLKQIANNIRFLLNSHGELVICDLSNLIYELVCQTQVGSAVKKGCKLNANEFQKLRRMYMSYCNQSSLIRNLRRRLYDVLNVMISASVVKRHRGKVRLAQQPLINATGSIQRNDREIIELLKLQTQAKLSKLKEKRQQLQQAARDWLVMKKLGERNEGLEIKEDEGIRFPLLVLSCESTHNSAFSETTVNIRSAETLEVWTEMNLIEQICPVSAQDVRRFLQPQ